MKYLIFLRKNISQTIFLRPQFFILKFFCKLFWIEHTINSTFLKSQRCYLWSYVITRCANIYLAAAVDTEAKARPRVWSMWWFAGGPRVTHLQREIYYWSQCKPCGVHVRPHLQRGTYYWSQCFSAAAIISTPRTMTSTARCWTYHLYTAVSRAACFDPFMEVLPRLFEVADHCFNLSLSFFISLTVCFLIPYSSQRLWTEAPASYYFKSCSFFATERHFRCFFSIAIELDALDLKPELDGLLWKNFEIGVGAMMLIRSRLVWTMKK